MLHKGRITRNFKQTNILAYFMPRSVTKKSAKTFNHVTALAGKNYELKKFYVIGLEGEF